LARHPHILLHNSGEIDRYTSTRSSRQQIRLPERSAAAHGAHLIAELHNAQESRGAFPRQVGNGFYESPGIVLTFESEPDFPLVFESLDLTRSKIQLLSVKTDENGRTSATVHVPDDKLQVFLRRIEAYRGFDDQSGGKPRNNNLVASIASIKLATLRELWTDVASLYPPPNTVITWEVWIRRANRDEAPTTTRVIECANDFGYSVVSTPLEFVDRSVLLIRGSREQLSNSLEVLGVIAEVRKAKVTSDFFTGLPAASQHEWAEDLLGRISLPSEEAPAVGLLDTGVNRGHPLLEPLISDADLQTLKPGWGVHDAIGHGTQMAGLAIYGDLNEVLSVTHQIQLTHSVQSLKLFNDADPHDPDLYGAVTIEGVSRLEIDARRRKIYCLAITADARDLGRPSSWSAAIDKLAFGGINEPSRLILISAGNVPLEGRRDYPSYNEISTVHDPGQAWNALTIGGYTEKATIDQNSNPGWTALASTGDLAPSSSTSIIWPRIPKTPFKPDIVLEAGNMGRVAGIPDPDFLPELQLLTTNNRFNLGQRPFSTFHCTSAATALGSGLAAQLLATYPSFTSETLRAMLVHCARWTPAMLARCTDDNGQIDTERLVRTFGYGAPQAEILFRSASNNLTLIAQETLQPFFKDEDGRVKTRDIKFHSLPWPRDVLLDLPFGTPVEMRVTLSYFVEPSPGERGWDKKYGYASHGLRFKVIRAAEDLRQFRSRINAYNRDEDYEDDHVGETGIWDLGVNGRTNGSIHSNTWRGTAADLANRSHIAVHPVIGWWRTRTAEERYDQIVRYTLVVSISTPDQLVDIYTPVANQIGIPVVINI